MAFDPNEQFSMIPLVYELSAQMIERFKRGSDADWNREGACTSWARANVVAYISASVIAPDPA